MHARRCRFHSALCSCVPKGTAAAAESSTAAAGESSSAAAEVGDQGSSASSTSPAATDAIADMLTKMAAYVKGEAEISVEDYRLLQAMNLAAAERYSTMAEYSSGLVKSAENLQGKCEDLLPQLAQVRLRSENFAHALRRRVTTGFPGVVPALMQIDVLEAQVGELESAVEQLDSYSKRLEMKFSALQNQLG